MPRPPTPVGTYGAIKTTELGPKLWEARARFRMADGRLKRVRKRGRSATAATNALKEKMSELTDEVTGNEIKSTTRMARIIELYLADVERQVRLGGIAPGTYDQYQSRARLWITPKIGELQACELFVPRLNDVLTEVQEKSSYDSAKGVRAVLNGICGYAVRQGAMSVNPMRSVGQLSRGGRKKQVVALDLDQRIDLLERLDQLAQEKATDKDGRRLGPRAQVWALLPDLVRCQLASGGRIGEMLALVGDDEVDPAQRLVTLSHHIVRVTGQGLRRVEGRKGNLPPLTLAVPSWSVPTWRQRKLASGGGPLFPAWTGELLDPSNVAKRMREAFDTAGYGWVTSHVFRKTVGRVLDEAGLSNNELADQLGNTPDVVEDHYRQKRAGNRASADALESMMRRTEAGT